MIIISGPRCAGKTVLGQHLAHALGARHIEASDLMRKLWSKDGLLGESLDDFALRTLETNPCAVPNELRRAFAFDRNLVLTGLRSANEVSCIKRFPDVSPLVVYVDADRHIRVARCADRGRNDTADVDLDGMLIHDSLHIAMGLNDIRSLPDVIIIKNNSSSLANYFRAAEESLSLVGCRLTNN